MDKEMADDDALYPFQMDMLWFAVDDHGYCAGLVTAGVGPMPRRYLETMTYFDELIALVLSLPRTSSFECLFDYWSDEDEQMAQAGFFVYDWVDVHRSSNRSDVYEVIVRPTVPVHVSSLPPDLVALLTPCRLPGADFRASPGLDVRALVPSVWYDGMDIRSN